MKYLAEQKFQKWVIQKYQNMLLQQDWNISPDECLSKITSTLE